jgi:hypothetical protein
LILRKVVTTLAFASVVVIAGCKEDTFIENFGVCPVVLSTTPEDGATLVPLSSQVTVTFNEEMNPETITQTSFTLTGPEKVPGEITYDTETNTLTFVPQNELKYATTYTGRVTTSVKDRLGNALQTDYVWSFTTLEFVEPDVPKGGVDLKSVGRFGIFAGVGISNNAGFSEIRNLDVGITPGVRSSVTGFPPAIVVNGAIYASDDSAPAGTSAMLTQAKQHLLEAYLFAEGASSPAPATVAGDQGGKTLAPGIYKSTSTLLVQAGDLTLDAQGDPNAVWIFQIASDFTTVGGAGGNIILTGGAQAKNIFWQTGSSATIGDGTSFKGNVLALTSITMNSGATAVGRMLARNGSVVMTNTNIITKP